MVNRRFCRNDFPIYYLGKADLIQAKQTAGRLQDLADIDELRRAGDGERETAQIVRGEAWQRAAGDTKLPADGKL